MLDDDQFERLVQIGLQFKGPFAIDDPQFSEAVRLNDDQVAVIRDARLKQRDLNFARIQELLGATTAKKWKTQLGDTFNFRGELRELRTYYLTERQRADRRGRNDD